MLEAFAILHPTTSNTAALEKNWNLELKRIFQSIDICEFYLLGHFSSASSIQERFRTKIGVWEESWLSYIWKGYRMHFLRALLFLCKNGSIKHKGCRFSETSIRRSAKMNKVAILSKLPIFKCSCVGWHSFQSCKIHYQCLVRNFYRIQGTQLK